jgi:hypothetical protein
VQLVGTAHGNRLENLIKNPTLSDIIGGIQAVTLGDEEARRRGSQKTVLERKAPPTFEIAVEMWERQRWAVHEDVARTVDDLLRGREPALQVRTVDEGGEVIITQETPNPAPKPLAASPLLFEPAYPAGWRASGRMAPLPPLDGGQGDFQQLLDRSWYQPEAAEKVRTPGPNGEDWPVYVYPYGIGRAQVEQVIDILQLPLVLTKDLGSADAVLALRSHLKKTQVQLAKAAKMSQPDVSAAEKRADHLVSTLRRYVRALGGELEVNARFGDLRIQLKGV